MKRALVGVVVLVLAFFVAGVSVKASQSKEMAEKPSMEESTVVTVTATVEAVDVANHTVTLKGPKGNVVTLKVDERVKNLPQVAVGDKVTAEYYESLAVQVLKPGEAPAGAAEAQALATAKPGEKPAGVAANVVTVTTTIEAIDKDKQTVTLKGPGGGMKTVKVRDPKNLEKVEVGDQVVITYTEALAISVKKTE